MLLPNEIHLYISVVADIENICGQLLKEISPLTIAVDLQYALRLPNY